MRALYLATNGSNWQIRAGWPNLQTFLANVNPPQNTNMSNWYGITCTNGRITRINLPFNKLNGLFPTEFGGLLELTFLNLSENQLNGTIPSNFLNCINLQELNLEKNKLSGKIPKSINSFSKLTVLNLATNSFNDSIPKNISKLSKLRSIDFRSNKIVGSIPDEIKSLPFLTSIDISNNRLSGKLPSFLALLDNLQNLNLSQNQFSGCIDSLFKNLCGRQVNFSNNGGLTWKGDFSIFCNTSGSTLSQIGEPCGGCNNNFFSEIKPDCTCSYTSNRSIKGNVFLDFNNDGLVDIKEIQFKDVQIAAYPDCEKSLTPILTTTNANGEYSFSSNLLDPNKDYFIDIFNKTAFSCDVLGRCVTTEACENLINFACPKPNCSENPYSYNDCDEAYENPLCDLRIIGQFPCSQNPSELGPWNNQQHCQGTFKNTSFYGFVAGSGAYDIQFTIFNCAGTGVQYGIMDACNPDGPFILCDGNSTGNGFTVTISGGLLEPCKNYVFWINGYEGSVCSYYANVIGDWNSCNVPDIEDIKLESACTPLCPSLKPITITAIPEPFSIPAIEEINAAIYNWSVKGPGGVTQYSIEGPDGINLEHVFIEAGTYEVCLSTYHPCDGDSPVFCKTFTFENIENDYREFKICNTDFPWSGAFDAKNKPILDKHGNQWKWLGGNITLQMVKSGILNYSSLYENECGCTYLQSFRISTTTLCVKDNGTLQLDSTNFPTDSISSEIFEDAKPSSTQEWRKTNYQVFPNPTNGKVFITPNQPTAFKVDVYSMSGLPLESSLVESKTHGIGFELSLDQLLQAMYLIRISDDKGFSYHRVMKY